MKKLAYLECPTGIAGDMCLGALVSAGVPLDYLVETLSRLGIADEYQLSTELVHRQGQQATKFHVDLTEIEPQPAEKLDPSGKIAEQSTPNSHHHAASHSGASSHGHTPAHSHPHSPTGSTVAPHPDKTSTHTHTHTHTHAPVRHLPEIEQLIRQAHLPAQAEAWSLAVFRRLAEAEGAVHGVAAEQVHFHEVGATDAIVDIVGSCLGFDWLGIDQIYCSALPTGGGTVWAAHGRLPVPTPAVLKLWEMRQVPIYSNGIERELVTPTGAAIATTLATQFGAPPAMTLHRVGLGAGSHNLPIPNILRLWIGEASSAEARKPVAIGQPSETATAATVPNAAYQHEPIAVLETQVDDLNPQAIGYVFEALLAAGAVDVFTQPIAMKKSRPGVLLSVICHPDQIAVCESLLFRETTTLGIRCSIQQRAILRREVRSLPTEYGPIRIKLAWMGDQLTNVQPEYEDCAAVARSQHLPWRVVHQHALQTWHQLNG